MRISDWSSDVCSSDLNDGMATKTLLESFRYPRHGPGMMWEAARDYVVKGGNQVLMGHALKQLTCDQVTGRWKVAAETLSAETITINAARSEERRVGKECVSTCSYGRSTYY